LDTSLQNRTRHHYDSHPFDAITAANERAPRSIQPKPFIEFCDRYLRSQMAVAVRARRRAPHATFVCATAMTLPFADSCFDAVIADGVIHHAPDARAAFRESVRVLHPGGYLYVGIYNRRRYYYYIYTYAGPPIRWLERSGIGRAVLSATLIPLYYLVHLAKSRGKRTWAGASNFFYDYIITPRAMFYTREEVTTWGDALGLGLTKYDPSLGNVHVFVFRKANSQT
jgi:ubiquinone/menaquinone biosynthesis C-methylase UbiE